MKRMSSLVAILLAVMLTLVTVGCAAPAPAASQTPAAEAAVSQAPEATAAPQSDAVPNTDVSGQYYVEVTALTGHPYFLEHKRGVEMAGKALGVKTAFIGPVDFDLTGQINALEQEIAKKPNGIAVVGLGEELAPSINKAIEAGIPVVTVDGDVPSSNRISFVGTGNYSVGSIGGTALAKAMNERAKFLF